MKILHYMPGITNGGVASLVYDLSKYYLTKGHTVDIATSPSKKNYFQNVSKFNDIGINVFCLPKITNVIQNILFLRREMQKYDVIHVHLFPHQLVAILAFISIPSQQRPVIVTTEHNTWNNRRKYSILKYLDRWFYKKYSHIIAISPETEINLKDWLNYPQLNTKISTILNGINISRFRDANNRLNETISILPDTKYVVMVARMVHPKDPITLVKAIQKCDETIHAVFIGDGPLINDIKKTAIECGLTNRIHLLGARRNVNELIKGCHLGILSTHWDGFGLVAAEYMAAGIPVLASNVEGLRDVVGNKELLFNVGDYDTLSKKITRLLSDNNDYQKYLDFCTNQVENFSDEKMGREYLDLYHQLSK